MTRKDIIDTEVRTPAEHARTFLLTFCVGFTVLMIVCMILGSIFADEQAKQGIMYCWSLLGACVCATLMQFVFFTPTIIKRLSYPLRLLAFGICLYVVLAILAITMKWFPANEVGPWISFTVIYLATLAITTLFYEFKQRRESRKLNEGLSAYRRGKA